MNRPTFRRTAAVALSMTLAACGGGAEHTAQQTPSGLPSPSASPSLTSPPSPVPHPLVSPLTGLPVGALGRVIAIKIDNAPLARPQSGLDQADVVYEELVEGGSTRFLAVYSSRPAGVIGPVRSVRENDVELLREYGPVLFGFSGGNAGVKATVRRSDLLVVSYDAVPSAYWKAGRRADAFNYMTSTDRLLAARSGGALAHDIGLRFGPTLPARTRPARDIAVHWGHALTAFHYDPTHQRWYRYMDGRPAMLRGGGQMSTPNVIIQQVRVTSSRYTDKVGSRSPYTVTTGSGKGLVLRDGVAVPMTWKRTGTGATHYLDAAGHDILLKPGPVWILLAPTTVRIDY